jgi:hypothetical protein
LLPKFVSLSVPAPDWNQKPRAAKLDIGNAKMTARDNPDSGSIIVEDWPQPTTFRPQNNNA